MPIKTYEKHPLAQLDYGYNLSRWLTGTEVVTTVNATKISGTVTVGQTVTDGKNMGVMITGGADGERAIIDITGTTNSVPPRTFARRFEVFVTVNAGLTKPV